MTPPTAGRGPQRWTKLQHLFAPDGETEWMVSHASVPILAGVSGNAARVLFSSRSADQRSYTGWVEVELGEGGVLEVAAAPLLEPGPPGFFDADGTMATDLIEVDGRLLLYYIGWNRAYGVPFRNAIGVAVSDDGGATFHKHSPGPVLDRSVHDPCFVASCCVRPYRGHYRMWYLSCVDWERQPDGTMRHRYHLKAADSPNALDWTPTGHAAIDFAYPDEYAISVPRVFEEHGIWRMWYSYRGGPRGPTYRIGYAESSDGENWERLDHLMPLDPTPGAWDGEMVCYPYLFDHAGERYLLYNGDGYGRTGFGLAALES